MKIGNINLSSESFKEFLSTFLPWAAIQLANSVGPFASMIMIAQSGGPHSMAIIGLANLIIFLFYVPISQNIIELGGVYMSISFGAKKFDDFSNYMAKSLFSITVLYFIALILFYFADKIMIFAYIKADLAIPAGQLILQSMAYIIFMNLNTFVQTFLSSQQVHKFFNVISLISAITIVCTCYYFIIYCDMKEFGYVPAKLIQEAIVFVLYLALAFFESEKECFRWPDLKLLFVDFGVFLKRALISSISVMGESVSFEFNTYIAAAFLSVNEFAIWEAWAVCQIFSFLLGFAFGSTLRTNIGNLIGEKKIKKAKEESIAYFIYVLFLSIIITVFYWFLLDFVVKMFFVDPFLQNRLKKCFEAYLIFIYFYMIFFPIFTMFRLLRLEYYFLVMIAGVFPVLVIVINLSFVMFTTLGVAGIVYGHIICTVGISCVCLHKIFWIHDWETEMGEGSDMIASEHMPFL